MAGLTVEFPASQDPVSLTQAKNFLRVDDIDDDDELITGLITAATVACENFTKRSFMNKGFLQTLDSFPYFTDTMLSQMAYPPSYYALPKYSTTLWNYSQMIKLFRPPLVSVDRITYMDSQSASYIDMVPQPLPWYPQTVYANGAQVADNNGNIQQLVATEPSSAPTGKSGTRAPVWGKDLGDTTAEASPATAVWVNMGPMFQGEFGSYIVDSVSEPARIFPGISNVGPSAGFWPSVLYVPNAVQIHFTAGYGNDPADVPQNIISAILMLVNDMYENRTPTKDAEEQLPKHVRQLLWPSKVMDFTPTRG
jgi:Phage gp6-like head-tail connector protein